MSFDRNNPLPSRDFNNLVKLISILRNECPWDRKQTHDSLKYLMIEEMYEALESIDAQDFDELKKELGDILLHVVFHAEIATENRHFDIGDVIYNIMEKLIRRHPHVFNGVDASDEETVKRNWESIKKSEGQRKSVLEGVPGILPGLLMAQRMQEKAGGVGFDWKTWKAAWPKLQEELGEFRDQLDRNDRGNMEKEFGDLLFSVVNVGRLAGLNAEDCLRMTNNKFRERFTYIEDRLREKGLQPENVSLEEMDVLWEEAKEYE